MGDYAVFNKEYWNHQANQNKLKELEISQTQQ